MKSFSKHLFWDTERSSLDLEKDKSYIIKQVLEYGLYEDWSIIYKYYGITGIVDIATKLRELDPKAMTFISLLSDTPLTEYRCYTYQQSIPKHWNF